MESTNLDIRTDKEVKLTAAISEGRKLAYDKNAAGYTSMEELKAALDI